MQDRKRCVGQATPHYLGLPIPIQIADSHRTHIQIGAKTQPGGQRSVGKAAGGALVLEQVNEAAER